MLPATLIRYEPCGCDTIFNSFSFSFTLQCQKSDVHPLNHHFQQGCWLNCAPSPPSRHQGSHLLTLAPRPLKTSWKLQPCAKQIPSSRSTYLPSQKKSTSRYPDHHATCHVLPCCKQSSAGFSLGGWGHQTVEGCAATKEIRVGEAEWQDHNKSSLFLAFPFTRFPSGLKWNSRNHEDRFVPD